MPEVSTSPLRLRAGLPGDAPRLHEIHSNATRTLCSPYYEPAVIDGWLEGRTPAIYVPLLKRGALFVAETDSGILGFGEATPGSVLAVYVDPAAARRGIGTAILGRAIELARQGHEGPIRVQATLNARAFYELHGFRETHRMTVRRNHVDIEVVAMEMPANHGIGGDVTDPFRSGDAAFDS